MSIFKNAAPAVRKETRRIAVITLIGLVLMIIGFAVGHAVLPEKIPFDYRVFAGGIGGSAVAVLNFFRMGLAVQKASAAPDEDTARLTIRASYSQRMMMMIIWMVLAAALPCFQVAAGLLPLLFPSLGIKILTLAGKIN